MRWVEGGTDEKRYGLSEPCVKIRKALKSIIFKNKNIEPGDLR